jgi:hypothetical protein
MVKKKKRVHIYINKIYCTATNFFCLLIVDDEAVCSDSMYRSRSRENSYYDKVFHKQTKFEFVAI